MVTNGTKEPREITWYRDNICGDRDPDGKCAACKRSTEDVGECYGEEYVSAEPREDPEITAARQQEE